MNKAEELFNKIGFTNIPSYKISEIEEDLEKAENLLKRLSKKEEKLKINLKEKLICFLFLIEKIEKNKQKLYKIHNKLFFKKLILLNK